MSKLRTPIVPDKAFRGDLVNGSGSTITKKRLVKLTAEKVIAVATASTDNIIGLVQNADIADGKSGDVMVTGKGIATSGAAISAGAKLTTDSTGRVVTATVSAGTTVSIVGQAVTAAAGANEDVEVELMPQGIGFTGSNSVADATAVAAIAAGNRYEGLLVVKQDDGSLWRFSAAGTAVDTTSQLAIAPAAGTGAWLRADKFVDLKLAIGFGTADAATLFTVPVGMNLVLLRVLWEVTTSFAGGSSSAIGVSTNTAPHSTKGDLLGGSGGDVAATLVSTGAKYKGGTLGADFATSGTVQALAGHLIRFDRITDAFTSGAGFVHVLAMLMN